MSAGDLKYEANSIHIDGPNETLVIELQKKVQDREGEFQTVGHLHVTMKFGEQDENTQEMLEVLAERLEVAAKLKASVKDSPRGFFQRFVAAGRILIGK